MSEDTENQEDKFLDQVQKDLKVDQYDLEGDSRHIPNLLQKYTDMLRAETRKMNTIKLKMDEIYAEQLLYYMKDHPLRFNAGDARKMTECDPRMIKVRKLHNTTNENVEYLKNVMWNLREKTKCITNIIQIKRLEVG